MSDRILASILRAARAAARFGVRLTGGLAACAALPATAASDPAPTEAARIQEVAPADARPALWKIADRDTTIWLFGTIHALPPGMAWFDGRVAEAFASSQELVTEVAGEDPARTQTVLFEKAMLAKGTTLRSLLAPEANAKYEAALTTLGYPVATFDTFEPWYAAIGLSTLPLLKSGYARENGVEGRLEVEAKTRALPHGALETSEYQLGLFDALPLDVQTRYLSEVVDNLPTIRDDLGKMIVAWQTGNADELARLMNAQEDDPELVENLLIQRNRNWAGWIGERLARPGSVFLAVGAGHLAGPGSVQEQLAARGIDVTRVQ